MIMVSEEIKEQFREVIRYSQGIENPQVDELFETFCKKKYFFYHAFGDALIWEDDEIHTYHFTDEERKERLKKFIQRVLEHYDNYTLSIFIERQQDGFFENKVAEDWQYDDLCIKAGTKLLKAFKHFVKDDKIFLICWRLPWWLRG